MDIIADYKYQLQVANTVANTDTTFVMADCTRWVQIAVETSATYKAGTLTVYFKPYGLSTYLPYYSGGSLVTIDLASPKALILQDFAISGIKLVVSGTGSDSGKTFNASVTSIADNAKNYKL